MWNNFDSMASKISMILKGVCSKIALIGCTVHYLGSSRYAKWNTVVTKRLLITKVIPKHCTVDFLDVRLLRYLPEFSGSCHIECFT